MWKIDFYSASFQKIGMNKIASLKKLKSDTFIARPNVSIEEFVQSQI